MAYNAVFVSWKILRNKEKGSKKVANSLESRGNLLPL